jgi:hypothetical protein
MSIISIVSLEERIPSTFLQLHFGGTLELKE